MMIMFPLTFLSNAFVPTDTMPGWLQAFVKVNPVTQVIHALPRPHERRPVHRPRRLGAARLRGGRCDLRAARGAVVHAEDVI